MLLSDSRRGGQNTPLPSIFVCLEESKKMRQCISCPQVTTHDEILSYIIITDSHSLTNYLSLSLSLTLSLSVCLYSFIASMCDVSRTAHGGVLSVLCCQIMYLAGCIVYVEQPCVLALATASHRSLPSSTPPPPPTRHLFLLSSVQNRRRPHAAAAAIPRIDKEGSNDLQRIFSGFNDDPSAVSFRLH